MYGRDVQWKNKDASQWEAIMGAGGFGSKKLGDSVGIREEIDYKFISLVNSWMLE